MKVGIFGGSFNPPHLGHIHISNLAIKKLNLNQIWWVPTLQNPLKETTVTPYEQRLLQCLEITKNNPKIFVKDFKNDSVITYNLIKKIKAKYSNYDFYFIAGYDILEGFRKWHHYEKLLKLIKFAIFSRSHEIKPLMISKEFKIFYTKKYDISSTEIRNNNR